MEQTFVSKIFWCVAKTLQNIANTIHLTYNEINIIVYYMIIPLTWCVMLDIITHTLLLTPLFTLGWIISLSLKRKNFKEWCDKVFIKSQQFIRFFGEYVKFSVIICVIIPIIIYGILIAAII